MKFCYVTVISMDLGGTLRRGGGRINEVSSETHLMTWYVSTETVTDGDWWKLVWGQRFIMASSLKCSSRKLRYPAYTYHCCMNAWEWQTPDIAVDYLLGWGRGGGGNILSGDIEGSTIILLMFIS